jgi:hypothetical protein
MSNNQTVLSLVSEVRMCKDASTSALNNAKPFRFRKTSFHQTVIEKGLVSDARRGNRWAHRGVDQ